MATYYNPRRTAFPVTLSSGRSTSVPGKGRLVVEPGDEGSESLQKAVSCGNLVRLGLPAAPEVAAPELAPVPLRFPGEPPPEETPAPVPADHVVRAVPVVPAPPPVPQPAPVAPIAVPPEEDDDGFEDETPEPNR